jgi:hypothetical protein
MKMLKFNPPPYLHEEFRWQHDVSRIVDICKQRGYYISNYDAQQAWEEYSDSVCASWLKLDDSDDDVFKTVLERCEVTE